MLMSRLIVRSKLNIISLLFHFSSHKHHEIIPIVLINAIKLIKIQVNYADFVPICETTKISTIFQLLPNELSQPSQNCNLCKFV